jgi:TetR/AcrR family transcriptional regulator, regulator of cefoperazone and chloramphenicol sensitivity
VQPPVKPRRTYNTTFRQQQARATRRRILDAARRLFAARGYAGVTMRDVAVEAGVAVQTVHAVFGTKLSLAQGIVEAALEDVNQEMLALIHQAAQAQDLRVTLYTVGAIARLAYERFGDVLLFLHEAGDPQLIAEAERFDRARFESQAPIGPALARAGLLRAGLRAEDAADLIWALSSPEWYGLLVHRRGWDPNRWQQTVGDALVHVLLG